MTSSQAGSGCGHGRGANPIATLLAEEGVRALAAGSAWTIEQPGDLDRRVQTLRGAWLADALLAAAGTDIRHQILPVRVARAAWTMAGRHAVVLPHAVRLATSGAGGATSGSGGLAPRARSSIAGSPGERARRCAWPSWPGPTRTAPRALRRPSAW